MKRSSFLKSLGIIVGSGMIIPYLKPKKLVLPVSNTNPTISFRGVLQTHITSFNNITLGTTLPNTILKSS
jgi:hypothetical protein